MTPPYGRPGTGGRSRKRGGARRAAYRPPLRPAKRAEQNRSEASDVRYVRRGQDPALRETGNGRPEPEAGRRKLAGTVKIKIRPRRRTYADDGDTYRKIFPKIVCEAKGRVRGFGKNFVEGAAEPSAACGGCSEGEQGQRSQSASAAARRAVRCGHRNPLSKWGKQERQASPCATVAPVEGPPLTRLV